MTKKKIIISKRELQKFVRQNKPTRFIAGYFNVSERTIFRRIKEYGLKGIRRKGRKRLVRKPKPFVRKREWIPTKEHIDKLNKTYHFHNINYSRSRYINPQTLVCSNQKRNPRGNFTTVGIYWIAFMSDIYFIYRIGLRYSEQPVSFKEIYNWTFENSYDMTVTLMENTDIYVEDMIGFTFYDASRGKPENFGRS